MTESAGIRTEVANLDYHSTPLICPTWGKPAFTVLSDKRPQTELSWDKNLDQIVSKER